MMINTCKKLTLAVSFLAITSVNAYALDARQTFKSITPKAEKSEIITELLNISGNKIGTVTLRDATDGTVLIIDATDMPEGSFSFHIHETASCDMTTEFKSAGGHLNPDGKEHGFYAELGPHAGDLPNIHATENGIVKAEVYNTRVTISGHEGKANLLDEDGSSIMIHANPDDYISQPTGGGGARIACAEIKTPEPKKEIEDAIKETIAE